MTELLVTQEQKVWEELQLDRHNLKQKQDIEWECGPNFSREQILEVGKEQMNCRILKEMKEHTRFTISVGHSHPF